MVNARLRRSQEIASAAPRNDGFDVSSRGHLLYCHREAVRPWRSHISVILF